MTEKFWILRGILGATFLISGWIKLEETRTGLSSKLGKWTEDFSMTEIRGIGLLELLGAIGIVIPGVMGLSPFYAICSSVCLCLLLIAAVVLHWRRRELVTIGLCILVLAINLIVLNDLVTNHVNKMT